MKGSIRFIVVALIVGSMPFSAQAVSIHLQVEAPTGSLYDSTIDVTACPVTTDVATSSVSAKCALEQASLNPQWTNYGGDDWFLTAAGGATQDFARNIYWGWWSNLSYGQVALNKHELVPNESLLVALGVMPLRIDNPGTVTVGATTTVMVEAFGFDAGYNGIWSPAMSTAVTVNGTSSVTSSSTGTFSLVATSTDPLTLVASRTNAVSATLTLTPTRAAPIAPIVTGGGSGGSGISVAHPQFDVSRALAYLAAAQHTDGSFDAPFLSDWAALAFAAQDSGGAKAKLHDAMLATTPRLSSVTDYERHALALEALGINPYSGTPVDAITPIVRAFDGTQIGNPALDNDDIFALFPLLYAGYTSQDDLVQKIVAFILSRQGQNGSWDGSVDMTAAAVQALTLVRSLPNVSSALAAAKQYLHTEQQNNGGFGNSFATSWALQAIAALGETSSGWTPVSFTPQEYLAGLEEADGGVEPSSSPVQTRVWATAYAIPAVLGKSWPALLQSFARPSEAQGSTGANEPVLKPSLVAIASTTPPVSTTTLMPTIATNTIATTTIRESQPRTTRTVSQPKTVARTELPLREQTAAVANAPTSGFFSHLWGVVTTFFSRLL